MLPNNFSREYSRQGHQPRCVYAKITPEAAFYDAGRPLTGPGSPALHALLSVLAGTVQLESGCPLVLTAALASRGPWRDQLYCVHVHDVGSETCTAHCGTQWT